MSKEERLEEMFNAHRKADKTEMLINNIIYKLTLAALIVCIMFELSENDWITAIILLGLIAINVITLGRYIRYQKQKMRGKWNGPI